MNADQINQAIASCSSEEVAAFEAWAAKERYDMTTHPLHWLFLNEKTYAARQGWRAALEFVRALQSQPSPAAEAEQPTGEAEFQERPKAGWWCPHCKEMVPDQAVTFYEYHDPNNGGCGYKVGAPPAASSQAVARQPVALTDEQIIDAFTAEAYWVGMNHVDRAKVVRAVRAILAQGGK